jgi:phage tail-like protein
MTTTFGGATIPELAIGARFSVEIGGTIQAYFNECSGLSATVKDEPYEEGGANETTLRFPGRASYGNVTLKRGMAEWLDLYEWFMRILEGQRDRQSVTITLLDGSSAAEPLRSWKLIDAFPVKWTAPPMKADSTAMAIETLEFAHQGLQGGK